MSRAEPGSENDIAVVRDCARARSLARSAARSCPCEWREPEMVGHEYAPYHVTPLKAAGSTSSATTRRGWPTSVSTCTFAKRRDGSANGSTYSAAEGAVSVSACECSSFGEEDSTRRTWGKDESMAICCADLDGRFAAGETAFDSGCKRRLRGGGTACTSDIKLK